MSQPYINCDSQHLLLHLVEECVRSLEVLDQRVSAFSETNCVSYSAKACFYHKIVVRETIEEWQTSHLVSVNEILKRLCNFFRVFQSK